MNKEFKEWEAKARMLGVFDDYEFSITTELKPVKFSLNNVKRVKSSSINNEDYKRELVTLEKYTGKYKNLILPPVEIINIAAFKDNKYIENIVIPNTVEKIECFAFKGCTNLKTVKINTNKINNIEVKLFSGCIKLETINIPESITIFETGCFEECRKLKSLDTHNIEIIKDYALYRCKSISYLNLNNLKALEDSSLCMTGLKEIILSEKLEILSDIAIYNCPNLKRVVIKSNLMYDDYEYITSSISSGKYLEGCPIEELIVHPDFYKYIIKKIDKNIPLRNIKKLKTEE